MTPLPLPPPKSETDKEKKLPQGEEGRGNYAEKLHTAECHTGRKKCK